MTSSKKQDFLEQALGIPFTTGNNVNMLNNGDEIFPAMLSAIEGSQKSIEFLTFVYWKGDVAVAFADALSQKAREGVTVRVLLDAFGSSDMDKSLVDKMRSSGVEVHLFREVSKRLFRFDFRTHRKILICDGVVGFTGGVGIASEWEGDARNPEEWREIHFEIHGPAVRGLSAAFWDNWIEVDALPKPPLFVEDSHDPGTDLLQVVRSSSGSEANEAFKLLYTIIALSEKHLDIVTPYFVPQDELRTMICQKAREGVEVRLLIPGAYTDRRFERIEAARYFDSLLDAGVKIFLYQKTMIHTKLIISDDDLVMFGSLNFNRRSMSKDEEIGVVALSKELNSKLKSSYEADLQDSKLIDRSEWSGPGLSKILFHKIVTPFRAQM